MKVLRGLRRYWRPEDFRSEIGCQDRPPRQLLDAPAMTGGYLEPPVTPMGDHGPGHAEFMRQSGSPKTIDKEGKLFHGFQFNQTKQRAQAQSLIILDKAPVQSCHTKRMNIPWYVKANAHLKELGQTRSWLAGQLGVHRSAVTHWFNGSVNPGIMRLTRIAEVLGMSLAELISDDNSFAHNDIEQETLDLIRNVPPELQEKAIEMFRFLVHGITPTSTDVSLPPPPQINAK